MRGKIGRTKGTISVTISTKVLDELHELRFKNEKNWNRSQLVEKALKEFLEGETNGKNNM